MLQPTGVKSTGSFPVKDIVLRKIGFGSLGLYRHINGMLQICTRYLELKSVHDGEWAV